MCFQRRRSVFVGDSWSNFFQSTVRRRSPPECRQFLCANSALEIAPCVRPVWRSVTDGQPNCRRHQIATRLAPGGVSLPPSPATHRGISTSCECRIPQCGWTDSHPASRRFRRPAIPPRPVRHYHVLQPLLPNTTSHLLADWTLLLIAILLLDNFLRIAFISGLFSFLVMVVAVC